jgi:methyltransferase-like protein
VTEAGDRPATTPLVWLQARTGAPVCNRRHKTVELTGLDRSVLALLDGTRDRAALRQALAGSVLKGDIELRQGGQAVTEPEAVRAMIAAELDGSLERLAKSALLVA